MALFTTYLGFLRKYECAFGCPMKFYYVMQNRGNNQVAPSKELLEQWLRDKKLFEGFGTWETQGKHACWPQYKKRYLKLLESEQAIEWMKKVAEESQTGDVVLVCYEKKYTHCHRRLLAREIIRRHPAVEYLGELKK